MNKFNLKYLANSKKGLNREKNQDRTLIVENDNYYIFLVFDGVSSYPLSYLFIEEFVKNFKVKLKKTNVSEANLSQLIYETHNEILNLNLSGMSTMSLLYFNKFNNNVNFISIGDTRIYIFTNQYIEKITVDDSLPHRRNVVTKCLGSNTLKLNDFVLKSVDNIDNYLICSDGFYSIMEDNLKDYFETLNFKNFKNIKRKLSFYQRRKNSDDSTYIIIKNGISE